MFVATTMLEFHSQPSSSSQSEGMRGRRALGDVTQGDEGMSSDHSRHGGGLELRQGLNGRELARVVSLERDNGIRTELKFVGQCVG